MAHFNKFPRFPTQAEVEERNGPNPKVKAIVDLVRSQFNGRGTYSIHNFFYDGTEKDILKEAAAQIHRGLLDSGWPTTTKVDFITGRTFLYHGKIIVSDLIKDCNW